MFRGPDMNNNNNNGSNNNNNNSTGGGNGNQQNVIVPKKASDIKGFRSQKYKGNEKQFIKLPWCSRMFDIVVESALPAADIVVSNPLTFSLLVSGGNDTADRNRLLTAAAGGGAASSNSNNPKDTIFCSDEFKAAAVMEFFEVMLFTVTATPSLWIYCRHLALILQLYRIGITAGNNASNDSNSNDNSSHHHHHNRPSYGNYRVELIVLLFGRIIDLHNFELIFMLLSAEEHACVLARIGKQ